ncbi:hypothetical protein [Natrinema halophilum]|uniref:Uncharacterized protein n=1 Tax=Natrinema halophilum TaxID=1699371 RepID=A0A7D5L3A4_9EURY|nr:hypothetical protein [Natrinema halophilum]QLG48525.1 hypothetical protein HYG82_06525 [Natrinema halophilum]
MAFLPLEADLLTNATQRITAKSLEADLLTNATQRITAKSLEADLLTNTTQRITAKSLEATLEAVHCSTPGIAMVAVSAFGTDYKILLLFHNESGTYNTIIKNY